MVGIGNNNAVMKQHAGKRLRRHNMLLRSIAAVLIPLMAIGPNTVLALHNEAAAYRAVSQALAAAVIAQSGPQQAETFTYDNNGILTLHETPSAILTDTDTDTYTYDDENHLALKNTDDEDAATSINSLQPVRDDNAKETYYAFTWGRGTEES